jgi:hypothetical protein
MATHITQEWINFFIAGAGASAALAGLVMVSVSVNIQKILKHSHLPAYAGATISTLVLVLVSSMAGLIDQETTMFGFEIFFFAMGCWSVQLWFAYKTLSVGLAKQRPLNESILHVVSGQVQTVPFIIGGVLLFTSQSGGLYWIASGILAVFIFSILHAWVLLVEILR